MPPALERDRSLVRFLPLADSCRYLPGLYAKLAERARRGTRIELGRDCRLDQNTGRPSGVVAVVGLGFRYRTTRLIRQMLIEVVLEMRTALGRL